MKKNMKTKMFERIVLLGLVAGSLGATVIAHAQSTGDYGDDVGIPGQVMQGDSYAVWCDQVTQNLIQAQQMGWNLYHRQQYTQARAQILSALLRAQASMHIPGNYRPATYNEILRTIALIQSLDATSPSYPGNQSALLKAKTIAYVALQRISFIEYVKNAVDVNYGIPCQRMRCRGDNIQYEGALANSAAEQLSRAQAYSSIVGRDGMVYPINDTPYYFVIVSKAARWAAEDLSTSLFNTRFSCAISNLNTLGSRAASYQMMLGDVSAVQEIHAVVDELISEMSSSPYGCGYRW